jgi:hypothetical protein
MKVSRNFGRFVVAEDSCSPFGLDYCSGILQQRNAQQLYDAVILDSFHTKIDQC